MAAAAGTNPEVNRLLGTEDEYGAMMGLDPTGPSTRSPRVGNYGEIFERNIGAPPPSASPAG